MRQENWKGKNVFELRLKRAKEHRQVRAEMHGLMARSELDELANCKLLNYLKAYNLLKDSIIEVENHVP